MLFLHHFQKNICLNPAVPGVQITSPGKFVDLHPVYPHRHLDSLLGIFLGQASVSSGDNNRSGNTLHIPFKRSWKGFVEIVQVKNQGTLGRCKHSEIADVAVAT